MKKTRKPFLVVAAVLLLLVGVLGGIALWQKNNIKAIWMAFSHSGEDLTVLQQQNEQMRADILESYGFQKPTEEQIQQAQMGMQDAQIADAPANAEPSPAEDGGVQAELDPSDTPEQQASTQTEAQASQARIEQYIAELYALEAQYQGKIQAVVASADSEFHSAPQSEWTNERKAAIIQKKVGEVAALEGQCDASVEAKLAQISDELKKQGKDTALVQEIRGIYQESKASWKAALLVQASS